MRRVGVWGAALIVGILLVTSCSDGGGEGSDGSAPPTSATGSDQVQVSEEAAAWAGEVCGALEVWSQDLATLGDEVQTRVDAGDLSGLRTTVQEAIDATQALLDELSTIEAPEDDQGADAQEQLDQLGEDARAALEEVEQGLTALDDSESAEEGLQALLDVAEGVGEQLGSVDETLADIEAQDPDGELVAALRADPACQSIGG